MILLTFIIFISYNVLTTVLNTTEQSLYFGLKCLNSVLLLLEQPHFKKESCYLYVALEG